MNDGIIEARIDCLNQVESIMFHLNEIVKNIEGLNEKNLTEMLRFANAAAYLVTTKKGAIRSMPEKEQVLEILAAN